MPRANPGRPVRAYLPKDLYTDFSTEELIASELNKFKGWKCSAGLESICIDFDGEILGASCGSKYPDGAYGKYGNIFEDFTLPSEWLTCAQDFCSCGADILIPKAKDEKSIDRLALHKNTGKEDHPAEKWDQFVGVERTFATEYKQVFWELGRRCNYDCSYCDPYIHNDYEQHKDLNTLINASVRVIEEFGKGRPIAFSISGGEPTVNPDFLEWVKFLKYQGHRVSVHTNGSRQASYHKELISLCDINLSVHFEFYNEEKLLEVIDTIIREIILRKIALLPVGHLEVNLMFLPSARDEIERLQERIWALDNFANCATLVVMPLRGHESIDNFSSTSKQGDKLINDYEPKDLQVAGLKKKEVSKKHNPFNMEFLKKASELDQIKDPLERERKFKELNN